MILLLFTLFYLITILLLRKWVKNAHSENGVWRFDSLDTIDVIIVLVPILNFLVLISYAVGELSWDGKKHPKTKHGSFAKRFFNIKD